MSTVDLVVSYIDENVLHSKLFDTATDVDRKKAVNQASNTLIRYMSDTYESKEAIPVEDIAEQVLWLLRIDDSLQRAEMGTTSIDIDGMSINMTEMDRTIAPNLLKLYGVTDIRKRRVGSYDKPSYDTYRRGNYYNDRRKGIWR